MIRRSSAFPIWLATLVTATVVGVPRLRPQELPKESPSQSKPDRFTRVTSRPAPPSQSVEVPITAGIGVATNSGDPRSGHGTHDPHGRGQEDRTTFFASIGIVARYDAWLNPAPSTVTVEKVRHTPRTIRVSSRPIDAAGNPIEPASGSKVSTAVTNSTANRAGDPSNDGSNPITASGDELRDSDRALTMLRDGHAALVKRDYALAFEQYRQAAPLVPQNGLPRFQMTFAQFALGDYEGAMYSLRRGLDLLPEMATAGFDLPKLYGEPQDLEEQRRTLESYVRIHPADREGHALLVWIDYCCGDLDAAERRALELTGGAGDDPLPDFLLERIRIAREQR